jgi:Flp pilus assembly protein TadG
VRGERGSVLLLVPAGVLVLVVLGAVAVDFGLAFLGQRELANAAAAAANDAAGAAVSDAAFYRTGAVALEEARAEQVAVESVGIRRPGGVVVTSVAVEVAGPQVCVTVTGRVPYLFSRAVPGAARAAVVRGQAVATAVVGGRGAAVARADVSLC